MLVSAKHQHGSATSTHMSSPSWASLPSPTPSHPSRLSQSSGLKSLSHRAEAKRKKEYHLKAWEKEPSTIVKLEKSEKTGKYCTKEGTRPNKLLCRNSQDQRSKEERGKLPEKEFRAMTVKMIQNLENRMDSFIIGKSHVYHLNHF